MSAGQAPGSSRNELTSQAISALTALARLTYTTPSGEQDRYDFGEIACHVITSVAANLGGIDALLAGRPGSWEADHVRQILLSSVPEDRLLVFRTEPVRLVLDPEDVFCDFGLAQMYDDERDAAVEATFDDSLGEDALAAAEATCEAIEQLYQQDLDDYATAYADTVRRAAAKLGITVEVQVERVSGGRGEPYWDELAERLHQAARRRTPIPATGTPPDWTGRRLPADAVKAAGRTYTTRATEMLRQTGGGGQS